MEESSAIFPTTPEADHKERHRGSRWSRALQANVIRLRRNGISLQTQLILLLVALVLLSTASLGSIAYRTSRSISEGAAVREVGITANFRKQVLIRALEAQQARAEELLKSAEVACSPEETWCLRKLLGEFVATEGASAARLVYHGKTSVTAGKNAAALGDVYVNVGEIAHFEFDPSGQPDYILQARSLTGTSVVTIRVDMRVANRIFSDRYGLGLTGETFLTDNRGFFLTPPRHPGPNGESRPIGGAAMKTCLAGSDGEVLAQGYEGAPVIYAFRHAPEIGGGCIMALIDQAEAFAPTQRTQREIAGISGLLAMLAVACSLVMARLVSRSMKRLTRRARAVQNGDFSGPEPVGGPAEVRMFARTFEAMAMSLKDSRAALQESSERTRNILESIGDGFAAFDQEWRCTYVNDKATELCGIARADILGKNVWKLFPNADRVLGSMLRRAMEEKAAAHFEEHYVPLDIWLEVDAYPTKDGLAVFGRDVTDRRRMAERLQQTQKLESLGVLAGGIAHDFNNLLTGIIGNASIALEDLPSGSSVHGSMEAVVNAGERAAGLTRQLLAYAGKGRFVIEPLSLSDLVREITSLLRTSIPRTVQLRVQLEKNLPPLEGDAAQIQQLIMNLVINAAEATEEGKAATVAIKTSRIQITQGFIGQTIAPGGISPGDYVMLAVRDAGCGMDEATVSRIFDPFFTTKFTGRGLGLAAVMGIVRGHKGALQVESTPGKGSCFKVLFPAGEGTAARPEPSLVERDLAGRGTVLVIDDEDAVRQTAKSVLEVYGYEVVVASNGKEGVNLFSEMNGKIAAVLLDMTMPVMSGEETLTFLKSIRRDVPVVLSSGYNEAEATQRFAGKGLAGFLQKPYTAARLAETIKRVVPGNGRAMRAGDAG